MDDMVGGDAARFGSLKLRFASPVFPGDRLEMRAWHDAGYKDLHISVNLSGYQFKEKELPVKVQLVNTPDASHHAPPPLASVAISKNPIDDRVCPLVSVNPLRTAFVAR